jgi:Ni/Co efflux regulator RcnB
MGWLLAAVVVFILLAGYVAVPMLRPAAASDDGDAERRELVARRDLLVRELRELALDRDVGKLAEADYESMRAEREAELAGVLRQLPDRSDPAGVAPGG